MINFEEEDPELGDLMRWWCENRPLESTPYTITPEGLKHKWTPATVRVCEFLYPNTGRNEVCPCGSGKKFKKCD